MRIVRTGSRSDLSHSASAVRSVSMGRVHRVRGNVGPVVLSQIREALALIFDLPI